MTGSILTFRRWAALARRPFRSWKRAKLLNVFLWWSMAAAILLPALSQLGYPVWSLEYVLVAFTALVIGLIFSLASKIRGIRPFLIIVLTTSLFLLYFGGALLDSYKLLYLVIPAFLAFMVFAASRPAAALRICGCAAFAQIAVTALTAPAPSTVLVRNDRPRQDVPSVIHVLLDGHAGIAAFPQTAVGRKEVKRLEALYLSRGFTVFRRAYSADKYTQYSITRLFNPTAETRLFDYDRRAHAYSITGAKLLERISGRWALDLTFTNHVDLTPAIRNIRNIVRIQTYGASGGGNTPGIYRMPIEDRLWNMVAMVRFWFLRRARSPLAAVFFKFTDTGQYWDRLLQPASRVSPLIARNMLFDLSARLDCCGKRGAYIFAHLIHPHSPFLFDETCGVMPSRAWLLPVNHRLGELDTLKTRNERWRRHFEQAYCAGLDVASLADRLKLHDKFSDAVIIVHGDHGSRIVIQDYAERHIEGYDEAAYETDLRGTFFAVRIPGVLEGRVVERPVRIDDLYHHLVENDFRRLDAEALKLRADSPYAEWARGGSK